MVVDSTVEHGSGVFADARADHGLTTWMVLDKVGDIVDDTGNRDKSAAILCLFNIIVPLQDWELLEGNTPVEFGAALVDLLLELLNTALFDFVGAELLQVVGQTKLLPGPDHPLGGVILVPFDGVAVVRRELVVEVVVALSKGGESRDHVVTRRVAVIEGLVTEPVGQRVDAEGSLLNEEDAQDTGVDEATPPVTPSETGH